ncbi:3-dehydroquinate synthase [Eubacterium multiforme]|uniref:3-dehydroquinate synthase n=1 Tax=Eubacterium multiforme TaxID=83339 RepID=A0ABT9UY35_9FIRM|nr:3-dehydroquinate synthase [Eubacterium multiforme]MDQ0151237.1 3-dehydroquinate synthase [Eubacterium multiforme]
MKELLVDLGENSYNIEIEKGLIKDVSKSVRKVFNGEKIFIITDKNVDKFYGDIVLNSLKKDGFNVAKYAVEPGEGSKSFNTLPLIYDKLLDFKLTRKDLIITLGGGVVGDLGGFVSATYLRGVSFIQIPTSLLSQVDSSVGGKVGVDLDRGKNLVGSFYQPKRVLIDPNVLNTLEDKFYKDGMGEVIKYGFIKDKNLYFLLNSLNNREDVMEHIEEIIYTCCNIKREIVEKDEKDLGERMVLNFGHTLGHAIEKHYGFSKFTHGEGVSIGMYLITRLAEKKGLTKEILSDKVKEILIRYDLPYNVEINDMEDIIETISLDKKNMGSTLKIIIMKEIGNAKIYNTTVDFFR